MHYIYEWRLFFYILILSTLSYGGTLTILHGTNGQADSELKALEKRFEDIGFSIAAKNEHLETHYYHEFKDKNLDLLNFYRIFEKEKMRELLLKNPDFGAYTPFNFLAYKKLPTAKDGNTTWYGYLDTDTMLNIIGEKDLKTREQFKSIFTKLDRLVIEQMQPKYIKKLKFKNSLPQKTLLKMVKNIDSDDIDSFVEEFIMEHDSLFTKRNFVIAGFLDLKFEYEDMDMDFEAYDAYWVSSLCHFEFSNEVFNHGEPQAGVFAPCSIYFYILKDSKELHMGYATVENWLATTGIKNPKQLEYMEKIAQKVESVFKELGFKVEDNSSSDSTKQNSEAHIAKDIIELKSMIKDLSKEVSEIKALLKKQITSKIDIKKETKFNTPKVTIGQDMPRELPTYYLAQPQSIESLKKRLEESGFEILATTEVLDGKEIITITNDKLKETNSFIAALNILVDSDMVRVQNPSYFATAYLGDKFDYANFENITKSLQSALGDLYMSEDVVSVDRLKEYSFMPELAHFNDFVELEEGSNLQEKIQSDSIAYSLKLPNGSILVGHKMRPRINKFLNKIAQSKNAQLLPYQSIVDDKRAYMMDPTFYLALSLPKLSMEEFMKIATTPDEIGRSVRRLYR